MKKKIALVLTLILFLSSVFFVAQPTLQADQPNAVSAASETGGAAIQPITVPEPTVNVTSDAGQVYVVVSGDKMWKIALKHHIALKQLIALNPQIKNPNLIFPGQKVVVSDATQAISADILIIGAGGAGLSAANAAIRNGADVLVIEKMSAPGGATAVSGGGFMGGASKLQRSYGVEGDTPDQIFQDLVKGGEDNYTPLTRLFADNAGKTIDWMHDVLKLPFVDGKLSTYVEHKYPRSFSIQGGAAGLASSLVDAYLSQNGKLMLNTKAVKLITEGSKVTGVLAEGKDGKEITIKANSVILATGGFGNNKELLPESIRNILYYGPECATGDGLIMAKEVGATTFYMDHAKVYPQGIEYAPGKAKVATGASMAATVKSGAIYVNSKGQRVLDENSGFVAIKNKTKDQPDDILYIVMDKTGFDVWKEAAKVFMTEEEINGWVANNGGTPLFASGADLKSAAAKAGIDPTALEATVNKFNQFCKNGVDTDFGRKALVPLGEGPYYIVEHKLRFASTLGGLKTNSSMQVLDSKDKVISGLYAAGEIVGGAHGMESMPTCNVSWALTTGKIVGDVVSKK